jgi:hypothetical protein
VGREAALTTTGRLRIARWVGSGKRGEEVWQRIARWLRRERQATWKTIRRRYMIGWEFHATGTTLYWPKVAGVRYRYRGRNIPTPWTPQAA